MIDMSVFTPYSAMLGGLLIGASAALLLLGAGRIAGISGIVGGLFSFKQTQESWRWLFLLGLLLAPWLYKLSGRNITIEATDNIWVLAIAGLMVGIGTRYAAGCTSGHGVCGLSRLSLRSLTATLSFMAAGFAMVYVLRHVL